MFRNPFIKKKIVCIGGGNAMPKAVLRGLKDKNTDDITTYDIIEGIKKDDPFAVKAYEYWQNLVLIGLISLANVFDPDSIILSGGMAKFINYEKLQNELNKEIVVSNVKLLSAKTENYAGLIGAAFLAVEKFSG